MNIKQFTTEQLEEELERRKELENEKPVPLAVFDVSKLKELCVRYIDEIANDELDDDTEHFIFEAAMVSIFGSSVWKFVNKFTR